jgi:hypothetical protein
MRVLSSRMRRSAKRLNVSYSFLFMKASGEQLREIGALIDAGIIRPVVDQVFAFEETKAALAYVEQWWWWSRPRDRVCSRRPRGWLYKSVGAAPAGAAKRGCSDELVEGDG